MKTAVTNINMDQYVNLIEGADAVIELEGGCQLLVLGDGRLVHYSAVSSNASMIEFDV